MFDNFSEKYPDGWKGFANTEDAVKFELDLLEENFTMMMIFSITVK